MGLVSFFATIRTFGDDPSRLIRSFIFHTSTVVLCCKWYVVDPLARLAGRRTRETRTPTEGAAAPLSPNPNGSLVRTSQPHTALKALLLIVGCLVIHLFIARSGTPATPTIGYRAISVSIKTPSHLSSQSLPHPRHFVPRGHFDVFDVFDSAMVDGFLRL